MGIIANFDIDELFKGVYEAVDAITDAVTQSIIAACMQTVAKARALRTYTDRTTLLRSSIGFVVYDHGQKVVDNFQGAGGASAAEGVNKGKQVAEAAAKEHPAAIVAVVVAGADYALYVESKGYDVVTGPCTELNNLLEQYLREAVASFQ